MRAIRLLAFLILAGAGAVALSPSSPARAAPVAARVLVPSASPFRGDLIQPAYWRRYYRHRHYWHRPYWRHRVWWHRGYHRRPHYYHRTYYHRTYWRPHYYHRHYWHPWRRRYWW